MLTAAPIQIAAFDALRRLTESTDGVLTRDQMRQGFEFMGARIPFANRPRGIWKPASMGPDGPALSITTASVRKGVTPRYDDQIASDEWFEYRYQGADPRVADNRALRQAFKLRQPLIYFYGVGPGKYEAIFPVYVIGDEPERLTFVIAADTPGMSESRLLQGGGEAPLKAYVTSAVKRRLHQHRFRELVIAAYGGRCTVCRLQHEELLDAAHIIEDHDERGKPEVPNGLSLCKIHHGAYDTNILGLSPDYRVHISAKILREEDGPMLRYGLQQMHGTSITVPSRPDLKPSKDYLAARFETFKAA
jgi:putative restriction endonuclease